MKFAAYFTAILFVMTFIAIVAWLATGFSTGRIQLEGTQLTFIWKESGVVADPVLHDAYFYVATSVSLFVVAIVAALPLAILGILTAVLFGRIPQQRES